jgi:hypothetical protein
MDNIYIEPREIEWGGIDRIDLSSDKYSWRALVKTVMNIGFHKNVRK